VRTILAGYDGTRSAERALTRVSELAQAFHSRVVVVSVAAPEPLPTPPRPAERRMPPRC
jgi:nucleotide-binding universal stress UspA family protein